MARRVAAGAALAIVLTFAAGACVWFARVRAVVEAIAQETQIGRVLLASSAPLDRNTVRSLARPGLRVVLEDDDGARVLDGVGGSVTVHPLPPGPEDGLPGPGALQGAPPAVRASFVASIAGAAARIPPAHLTSASATLTIQPDIESLGRWLAADVLSVCLAVAAIAAGAAVRITTGMRHERRALRALGEERREAAERYQHFLAQTAHELRTPLTIVSGYVDILHSSPGASGFDERIVEGLRSETARMRVLVAKMLTLARLESPAGVPRLIDVAAATQSTVASLQRRYPQRSISVVAGDAGRIVIDGDDFADALSNLLENAIKYAPDSEIAIAATAHGDRTVISVSDRGPGIALDEREKIFDRFYRGRDRVAADGLGLGLAIVKGVAERWGGATLVESVPGRTVFMLAFPVADEEVHALAR